MKSFKRKLLTVLSLPVPLLVFLLALLPYGLLYRLSWLGYLLLYRVMGYRAGVIRQNLHNSFPGKSPEEIAQITRRFYLHMADISLEAFKVMLAPAGSLRRRIRFSPESYELIRGFYREKRSFIVVMGHFGNWEWIGPGFNLSFAGYLHTAYKPLKNPVIDRLIRHIRSRFGHRLVASENVARHLVQLQQQPDGKAFAMVADQAASPATAHWLTFLNQDTPFYKGPEKLATKFNMPVVFCSIRQEKRGYYLMHAKLITITPREHPPGHITSEYARLLEEEIRRTPHLWLWSHRRWKHKRKLAD